MGVYHFEKNHSINLYSLRTSDNRVSDYAIDMIDVADEDESEKTEQRPVMTEEETKELWSKPAEVDEEKTRYCTITFIFGTTFIKIEL